MVYMNTDDAVDEMTQLYKVRFLLCLFLMCLCPGPHSGVLPKPLFVFKEPTFKGRRKGRVPLYLRILCLDTAVGEGMPLFPVRYR